ncbi:hypothetical protein My1_109 [Pectobacterium phage My1]|uniref:Uncharacterized protein n=1 Tax=Pectobacterium phage My1 TaxID=1204539 RepID=J9QM80_9CAUD|nr:hypothetical protein My1_109 [Pectobacterium phage My1]AFQ22268.1 hypothetical protein My1_109 [Pectobacterium phage My1]
MSKEVIYNQITAERDRQDAKWGVQDNHPLMWNTILMEEVGEAAEATLDWHWSHCTENGCTEEEKFNKLRHLREELIQIAAVAVAHIENLDGFAEENFSELLRRNRV